MDPSGMARRVHRFNQNAAQHFFIRRCRESVAFIRPSCWEGRDGWQWSDESDWGLPKKNAGYNCELLSLLLFKHLKRLVRIACLEHVTFSEV